MENNENPISNFQLRQIAIFILSINELLLDSEFEEKYRGIFTKHTKIYREEIGEIYLSQLFKGFPPSERDIES